MERLADAGTDHAAGFAPYQREFKPFVEGKQRSAAGFGRWAAPRTRAGIVARNVLTDVMSIPLIGKMMVKRSFVDRFELPA